MAPGWAVGVFIGVWLGLLTRMLLDPTQALVGGALPFLAAAFWLGGMNAGAAWLGWTA